MPVLFVQSGRFGVAAFAPTDIANLALWLDASDTATITHSSNAVSQWDDKSGNARHVTQGTGANKPTTNTTTQNGRNVLVFDSTDTLVRASTTIGGDVTVFAVFRKTGTANSFESFPVTLTEINVPRPFDRYNSSMIAPAGQPNVTGATDLSTQTTWCQITNQIDSAATNSYTEWKNGVSTAVVTGTSGGTLGNASQAITIAGREDGATHLTGDIAEIVIYEALLGTTDRETVEDYLIARWAI